MHNLAVSPVRYLSLTPDPKPRTMIAFTHTYIHTIASRTVSRKIVGWFGKQSPKGRKKRWQEKRPKEGCARRPKCCRNRDCES
eukprot:4647425-Pyramimonas_sp.AAC.1